jgi:hypothetical protein
VPAIRSIISPAIKAKARDDGWAQLSSVGQYVVNQHPSFDSRNYGFEKLGLLVRKQPFLEVKDVTLSSGFNQVWVRIKARPKAKKS